jgi:predicted outer membrane repeat protein
MRTRLAAGAGAALGAAVLSASTAEAATFTVTSLADTDELEGTLREEIEDANEQAGDDVIVFQSGLSGEISLVSPPLTVNTGGLDIQGPGADQITVDADSEAERVFNVQGFVVPNTSVRIAGLTLTGGSPGNPGGAILASAGLGSPPELTIEDAVITGNETDSNGGGVYVDGGSLTITNSVISENNSGDEGAGVYVHDTDGDQPREVLITQSVVSGNDGGNDGGGIYLDDIDGAALIERTTVSGNSADSGGGGIYVNADVDAPVTIDATTVSGNFAGQGAGGIYLDQPDYAVTIQSSTVSGNSSDTIGGGVASFGDIDEDEQITIRNTTIAHNSAGDYGGGINRSGSQSMGTYYTDTVELSSTTVADNSAAVNPDIGDDDADVGVFEIGFSLVENAGVATMVTESPAGSNIFGIDPQLGPLADNGGPTSTHLPALGSPALEAGIANGLATDQRGEARTFDATNLANRTGSDGTDIGATELSAAGSCKGKAATVLFVPGQKINGSAGKDVVVGTSAKDKIATKVGKDTVCAGGGNDNVKGGGGKDRLNGEKGKDTLKGGGGKDRLNGGPGKDKLRGGPGKDKLKGGGGKDSEVQ